MEEVKSLEYTAKPPYDKLRSILQAGLKTAGVKDDGKLEFPSVSGAASSPTKVSTGNGQYRLKIISRYLKKEAGKCSI